MKFIVRLFTSALAVLAVSYILPCVKVDTVFDALIVATVLAFLNSVLKPLLLLFSLPLIIFSFGIFIFVINVAIILITDYFVNGFHVKNFECALIFSLVLWLVTSILNKIIE